MNRVGYYEINNLRLTLHPKHIEVRTNLQRFIVIYPEYKYKPELDRLKLDIIDGRIRTLDDIASFKLLKWV